MLVVLLACTSDPTTLPTTTGDTGAPLDSVAAIETGADSTGVLEVPVAIDGPPVIECDDRVVLSAHTTGEATYGRWYVVDEDGRWGEEHPLTPAPDAIGTALSVTLELGEPWSYGPGVVTRGTCFPHGYLSTSYTHVVRVYDASRTLRDCVAWGPDAEDVIGGTVRELQGEPPAAVEEFAGCRLP